MENEINCSLCNFVGKSESELESHIDSKHELNCSLCNFEGKSESELEIHIDSKHPEIFSVIQPLDVKTENDDSVCPTFVPDYGDGKKGQPIESKGVSHQLMPINSQTRPGRPQAAPSERIPLQPPIFKPKGHSQSMTNKELEGVSKIQETYNLLMSHQQFKCELCNFFSTNGQILAEHQEKKHNKSSTAVPSHDQVNHMLKNDQVTLERISLNRKRSIQHGEDFGLSSTTKRLKNSTSLGYPNFEHEQTHSLKIKDEFKATAAKSQSGQLHISKTGRRLCRSEFNKMWKHNVAVAGVNRSDEKASSDASKTADADVQLRQKRRSEVTSGGHGPAKPDSSVNRSRVSLPVKNISVGVKPKIQSRGRITTISKDFKSTEREEKNNERTENKKAGHNQAETRTRRKSCLPKKIAQPQIEVQWNENTSEKNHNSERKRLVPITPEPTKITEKIPMETATQCSEQVTTPKLEVKIEDEKHSLDIQDLQSKLARANSEKEQLINRLNEVEIDSKNIVVKFGLCQKRYLTDIKDLKSKLEKAESKNGELQTEVSRLQNSGRQVEVTAGEFEKQIEAMSKEILSLKNANAQMDEELKVARMCNASLDSALKKTQSQLSQTNIYKNQDDKKLEYYEREFKVTNPNSKRFLSIKAALSKIYKKDEKICPTLKRNNADSFDAIDDDEVCEVVESMLQDFVSFKEQHKDDIEKILENLTLTDKRLLRSINESKAKSVIIDNLSRQLNQSIKRAKKREYQSNFKNDINSEVKTNARLSAATEMIRSNKSMTISTLPGVKISQSQSISKKTTGRK